MIVVDGKAHKSGIEERPEAEVEYQRLADAGGWEQRIQIVQLKVIEEAVRGVVRTVKARKSPQKVDKRKKSESAPPAKNKD